MLQSQHAASRKLSAFAFKGAPSAEEKQAEAAQILAARPDALLRTLRVKAPGANTLFPEGCDVAEGGEARRRQVIQPGASNAADGAADCGAQCRAAQGCNAWMWCDDPGGCRSEGDMAMPRNGCQLEEQRPAFAIPPPMSRPISKFVAGWQSVVGSKRAVPADQQIALLAPFTNGSCSLPYGEASLQQAFISKCDWAMLHSHELHAYPVRHLQEVSGTWYRLLILKQALETIPDARVGWLLMADQDVVVDDMTFEVPLSQYEGQDLVLYGSLKLVAADTYQNLLSVGYKDRQQGLDTGVLLMRNSEWSLGFVKEALSYLEDPLKQAEMRLKLKTWEPLLWEQNAVALLLQSPENQKHTAFEREYCINCPWAHSIAGKLAFMKRFSECSFCSGHRNSREQIYECALTAGEQFAHSNKMMYALTGCGQSNRKSELVATTGGRLDDSSISAGGQASFDQHGPIASAFIFLQANFITIAFIAVFLLGFLHKRKKRRHSSD